MSHTPPPMPDFPPSPAPKKNRTNAIIIGAAVAVIAAIIGTGIVVVQDRDDDTDAKPAAESSAPADETVFAEEEPEPTPDDSEPEIMGLTDGVSYEDGIEVKLSGYKRGVSSEWAAPGGEPFVSFTVKIDNQSDAVADIATGYVMCYYGAESQQAEQVFDSERGLEGVPPMKLRPGRTATGKMACAMPKDEEYLQVEMAPTLDSEVAIFAGNVK
ncbi:hypothetical protein ACIQ6R_16115 [Streptomyces sp. NPDC096048]|uniref:hypothetical protein n=1 Tax=Streptomyces sp. NPDC096048 TaxID=3366072 RepID=UPI00382D09EB